MASIADVFVTVLPETSKIAAGIDKSFREVDAIARKAGQRWGDEIEKGLNPINVQLRVDSTAARREIDEATKDRTTKVDVDVDTAAARTEIDNLARNRRATVNVDVDKSSLSSAASSISSAFGSLGSSFSIPGGIKVPLVIEGAALAPNIVPIIGQIVSAASQLSGVLGIIPAAAGAATLAVESLKVATSGFGDAIEAIGDPKKFGEAIAQLAPNAQVAARAIQGLMPQITSLKMTTQDAFFKGLGSEITALGNTYLPMFRTTMSQMAAVANFALKDLGNLLQNSVTKSNLQSFLNNAVIAFDRLSMAVRPFVSAFTQALAVGGTFLPRMTNAITEVAERFANFISQAVASGDFAQWIEHGITAFGQLKDIVVNTWNIFKGFFESARGPEGSGGLLQNLADLTAKWSEWMNSSDGQNWFKDFFAEAKVKLDELLNVLPSLEDVWGTIQRLSNAMRELLPILKFVADHIQGVITALLVLKGIQIAGAIGNIALAFGGLTTAARISAGGIAAAFGKGGAAVIALVAFGVLVDQINDKIKATRFDNTELFGGADNQTPAQWENRPVMDHDTAEVERRHNWIMTYIAPHLKPGETLSQAMDDPTIWTRIGMHSAPWGVGGKPDTSGQQEFTPVTGGGNGPHGSSIKLPDISPPQPSPGAGINDLPVPQISDYVPPPVPGSTGGGGSGSGSGGGAGDNVAPSGFDWDAVLPHEGGTWDNNDTGHNGHYGGLQFAPTTWEMFGGKQFASQANYATREEQMTVADRVAFYGWQGNPPQGLKAWEAITKGTVPGISTGTKPPRPTPQYGKAIQGVGSTAQQGGTPSPPSGGFPGGANVTYSKETMQSLGIPALYTNPEGGGAAQVPQWVQDFVKAHGGPSLVANSVPHPGLHGEAGGPGWAIDVSGSEADMDRLAQYLVDNPEESAQLIHQGAGGKKYGVAGGVNVSGTSYYADDYGNEGTMVHWAPSSGGAGLSGTGGGKRSGSSSSSSDNKTASNKGEDLGKSFVDGLFQAFGFDGTVFKDPRQFGIVKLGTALFNYFNKLGDRIAGDDKEKNGDGGADSASGGGSGGGAGGIGSVLDAITNPQPFGAPKPADQNNGQPAADGGNGTNLNLNIGQVGSNLPEVMSVVDETLAMGSREPVRNLPGPPR